MSGVYINIRMSAMDQSTYAHESISVKAHNSATFPGLNRTEYGRHMTSFNYRRKF